MPGWGRPLGSFLVSDPPLSAGTQPSPKAWSPDVPGPQGFLGVQPSVFHGRVELQPRLNTRVQLTQFTGEAWVRSGPGLPILTTQLSGEAWVQNYRQTSRTFDYQKDRMGPQGFLGVVPATFRDRLTLGTSDAGAHPSITNNVVPDDRYGFGPKGLQGIPPAKFSKGETNLRTSDANIHPSPGSNAIPDDRYGFGPKGLLGIPPRKFREAGAEGAFGTFSPGPSNFTGAQATQIIGEAWVAVESSSSANATQITGEVWLSTQAPNRANATQLAGEAWVNVNVAPPPPSSTVPPFLWVIT